LNDGRGIGSPTSRIIAAAAFALSPRVLTTLGAISSETLPIDAGAVGAAAGDPGAARPRFGEGDGGPLGGGDRSDGCGQRRRHPDRLPGRRHLVGGTPAEPAVAALHRMVAVVCGACGAVVGTSRWYYLAGSARRSSTTSSLPASRRMDVADRNAARHRRLDAVRRTERHRGRLVGDGVGRGVGDDVWSRRRAWPGWRCARCPPAASSS